MICPRNSTLSMGSSPRVWGQEHISLMYLLTQGIIPTRVGTSAIVLLLIASFRDHPHACGDKDSKAATSTPIEGSSPRVWGQVNGDGQPKKPHRIIPTRVGTSFCDIFIMQWVWDHPHACGDKSSIDFLSAFAVGSSPRVWGQV